eukprot:9746_1
MDIEATPLIKENTGHIVCKTLQNKCYLILIFIFVLLIAIIILLLHFYFDIFDTSTNNTKQWTLKNNIIVPESFEINYYANITSLLDSKYSIQNANIEIRSVVSTKYDNITIIYLASMRRMHNINGPNNGAYLFALIDYESDGINDDFKIIMKLSPNELVNPNYDGFMSLLLDNNNEILYIGKSKTSFICYNINQRVIDLDINDYINCSIFLDNIPGNDHDPHTMALNPITNEICMVFGVSGCDYCLPTNKYVTTIHCFNNTNINIAINKTISKRIANGIRNSLGMAFHPINNYLWFTDNGVDSPNGVAGSIPDGELNVIIPNKLNHFGIPYCVTKGYENKYMNNDEWLRINGSRGYNYIMNEFADLVNYNCSNYTLPAQILGPHVVPMGMIFYTGNMYPLEYNLSIFIAEKGTNSMFAQENNFEIHGYRIVNIKLDPNDYTTVIEHNAFAYGWMENSKIYEYHGRPVDIDMLDDGSLIISDSYTNCLYRITYQN